MDYVKKILKDLAQYFFVQIQKGGNHFLKQGENVALATKDGETQKNELKKRLGFYCPEYTLTDLKLREILSLRPIITFGELNLFWKILLNIRAGTFNVDHLRNSSEAEQWCELAYYCMKDKPNIKRNNARFKKIIEEKKGKKYEKTYLFGTGPSLEKASDKNWGDGYKIVCNTIVKDPIIWRHVKPDFIVAADARYHFGHTEFAKRFRQDLKKRLAETQTYFIYPQRYHPIVQRELEGRRELLIPIPYGWDRELDVDLTKKYLLPRLDNILQAIMLPLGCTLTKKIGLWGFDGRAPDDKMFWSNSEKHSYPELIDELKKAHPAFFEHHLTKQKPDTYVLKVHGDELDDRLKKAEKRGYEFKMMHKTWTQTLEKRR